MVRRFSETLGQYLKRERESRNVSLGELSRATRIGLPLLEALERNDFGFFSQREFILGFLKGYARHLGLDVGEVLGRYRTQSELMSRRDNFQQMSLFPGPAVPAEDPHETRAGPLRAQETANRKRPYWRISLQVIILSAALGISWYIHQFLKSSEVGERAPTPATTPSEGAKLAAQSRKEISRPEEKLQGMTVREKRGVVADRGRKVYYLSSGKESERLSPAQRVEFNSEEEAIKAGYRRASP
jgi:cytoskeletal protein RodZ